MGSKQEQLQGVDMGKKKEVLALTNEGVKPLWCSLVLRNPPSGIPTKTREHGTRRGRNSISSFVEETKRSVTSLECLITLKGVHLYYRSTKGHG
jgi:hypothetical protein